MISIFFAVKQPVRILLLILYVCAVAILSLLPPNDLPHMPLFKGADKVIHFLMYFIFSLLFCWALKTEMHYSRLVIIVFVAIGWGIFLEFVQFEMHLGRSFSWYDIFANSMGVFFGILIYIVVAGKYRISRA